MVGRTNAGGGGGGSLKVVSGNVSLSQKTTSVIAAIDFKPLEIITYVYRMYSSAGAIESETSPAVSYRASVDDAFSNNFYEAYASSWSCHRIAHTYDEATGTIYLNPLWKDSSGSWTVAQDSGTIRVYYIILGV
ncbi:MAG: hypothetical protein ACI4NU_09865 [Christensenellales bacterium]